MKNNLLKKILSIALVVLISGIIPSAAAFAAEIIVDGDYDITTSETVVDLGKLDYGQPFSHTVRVYASGGSVNGAAVIVNATGGLSATDGVFSGAGWANGYDSIVTGIASETGEFPITWSSNNNSLKNGPATIRFKIEIKQAKVDAIIDVQGFLGTYDGQPHGASGTATGINNENLNALLSFEGFFTNAPGGTANWNFAGNDQYNPASGSVDVVINKANANINVTGFSGAYDGLPHGASGTAKDINGEDLLGLNLGDTFTDVPGGTAYWSFSGGTNYNADSGSVAITINKVTPEVTKWPSASNITYGQSLSDSDLTDGTASVAGTFDFDSQNTEPNAGTMAHPVTFTPSDSTNYNEVTGSVNVVTDKADAVFDIDGFTGPYDGLSHGASGTATGVKGDDLSSAVNFGDSFTNVPGGTANWSFAGGDNYNDYDGSVNIVINKARATVSISGVTVDYDGHEHGATGTATSVDGVDLTHLIDFGEKFKYVPGGFAFWNFDGGINHENESGSVEIVIDKATPNVTWPTASNIIYGQSLANSDLIGGSANTEGSFDFVDPTAKPKAGTEEFSVKFIPLDAANYEEVTSSVNVVTEKADAIINISGFTGIYDGQDYGASGTAEGVDGEDLSYLINFGETYVNVPGGISNWSFAGDANYNVDSGSVEIVINKARATLSVSGAIADYDGQEHGATGTAKGINDTDLSSDLDLGSKFTDVPGGTANWTFDGGINYEDENGSVEIVINKIRAIVSVSGVTVDYDGEQHGATGTATGINNTDLSSDLVLGLKFTDVPGGTANWTFDGGINYEDESGSVEIVINKIKATVDVTGVDVDYDGEQHGAIGTATGINNTDLSSNLDLGLKFTDVPGGTANWTFDGGTNYEDESGSVEIVINKIKATVDVTGVDVDYDGEEHGASGTAKGINNTDLSSNLDLGLKFTDVPGGTANWTFDGGINYEDESGSVEIIINKIKAALDVTGVTVDYDGEEHGATGTAKGINNTDLSSGLGLGLKFTDVPGGTANWTFDGGINYEDENGSVAIVINQATPVLTWPTATITIGQKLESALLLGGMSSVSGTFTFNDPSTIPAPGNFEFDATFTPVDTLNYKTLSGKIKVATHYNFSGVLQPINRDGTSIFKAGSTVPVKFQLFNIDGLPISSAVARISYVKVTDGIAGEVTEAVSTSAATTGNLFRYDSVNQLYIFNLSTKGFKSGTYNLRIQLDDGTIQSISIGLK